MGNQRFRAESSDRDVATRTATHRVKPDGIRPVPEVVLDGRVYRLVENDSPRQEVVVATRATVVDLLTARELEVATLVASGRVNKQIAASLGISGWTVSTHLRRIFSKLGVDSRAAMVARCFGA